MSIFSTETQDILGFVNDIPDLDADSLTLDFLGYGNGNDYDIRPIKIATQFIQGYLSGFSTLPIGEASTNRVEQVARSLGHLGGFIGFGLPLGMARSTGAKFLASKGFSSAADAAVRFRSIPMLAADLAVGKLNHSSLFKSARSFVTRDSLVGRQMVNEGLHLGIASATSAWTEGFQAMGVSALHGAFFAGALGSIANMPLLKERTTVGNVLRTLSGSIVNVAPSYFQGADSLELGYQALLGAYFGYRQPTAAHARAQEYLFRDLREKGLPPTKEYAKGADSGYFKLPKEVREKVDEYLQITHPDTTEHVIWDVIKRISKNGGLDTSDIVIPSKVETASDLIRKQLEIMSEFDTNSLPGARLVGFSDHIIKNFGDSGLLNLERWDITSYSRLIGTFANQSRREGTDFSTFAKEFAKVNETLFGFKIPKKEFDNLRPYHASVTQDFHLPTFGIKDSRLTNFTDTQRNFDGKRIDTRSPLKYIHLIAQSEGIAPVDHPEHAAFSVIQSRKNNRTGEVYDLPVEVLMDMDTLVGPKSSIEIRGKKFELKDSDGNHLFYPYSAESDKARFWYIRYNLGQDSLESEWTRISNAYKRTGTGDLNADFEILSRNWYDQTYGTDTIQERPMIRIISGGQTGADQGGLLGARDSGLGTGGEAPAGFRTEGGDRPDLSVAFGLRESTSSNYQVRTRANIDEADGTVVFGDVNSAGSKYTINVARNRDKPLLTISNPAEIGKSVVLLSQWLKSNGIRTLNVAGNRESKNEGIQANVRQIIRGVAMDLAQIREAPSFETARESYKKMFVSNVRWNEAEQGNLLQSTADTPKQGRTEILESILNSSNDFIRDVTTFNKRRQPLFTSYYRLPSSIKKDGFSYAIISDLADQSDSIRNRADKDEYKAITDGAVLVSSSTMKKIQREIGMSEDGSSAKPFIVSPDNELGLLIGKTAFHEADLETSVYMEKNNIDFLIYESSAKQRGAREKVDFRLDKNGDGEWRQSGKEWGKDLPRIYTMDPSHVHVDFAKGDKSINRRNRVISQMLNTITLEQLSYVSEENGIPLPESRYNAPEMANTRFREYMSSMIDESIRGTVEGNNELEGWLTNRTKESLDHLFSGNDPIIDRVDKIRLYNVIFKRGNEDLRSKVIEHIMKDQETLLDFSEELMLRSSDDVNDKLSDIRYVQSTRRGSAVTVLEAASDKASVAMSKQSRYYAESLFGHWLIQGVTRPLAKKSMNMIMKPFSPGVAKRFKYDGEWIDGEGRKKSQGDLRENTFIMEEGLRDQMIDVPQVDGETRSMKLGDAWEIVRSGKSQPIAEGLKSGTAKEFKTGDKFQTEDFNVWEVISQEAYESESKVGMKVGVHVRFVTNVNPNESRRAHDLNPDATTYIKPGSIVTMGENVVASRFGGSPKKTKDVDLSREYRARVLYAMSVVAARVPMGDLSGAQPLIPIGFSGTKGKGIILHHKTMKKLGGADLDIDNAFVYWNLPAPVREVLQANRHSGDTFQKGRVEEFLRTPIGLPGLTSQGSIRVAATFDPLHRLRIGSEVARGTGDLAGVAINSKQFIHALYSHANKQGGEYSETLDNGTQITWFSRADNGELLRSRSDGAITASVDVSKFGAMADKESLKAILINAAFPKVIVRDGEGNESFLWRNDADFGVHVNGHLIPHKRSLEALDILMQDKKSGMSLHRMSIANAGIRGKRGNRLMTMEERISAFGEYPSEITSYIGTVSEHFKNIELPGRGMIDYIFSSRNEWEAKMSALAEFMNNTETIEFFPFLGDGPKLPYTAFHQFLRAIEDPFYRDKKHNIFTPSGRENVSGDLKKYIYLVDRLERLVTAEGAGRFLKSDQHPWKTSGTMQDSAAGSMNRLYTLNAWAKKIEDFISNDLEQASSLPVMRKYYLESRLRKEESTDLTRIASYIKGIFSAAFKDAVDLERSGEAADSDPSLASSKRTYALDEMARAYNGFVGGSMTQGGATKMSAKMRLGLPKMVDIWNQNSARLNGTEAKLDYNSVRKFLDSVLLSPYSLREGSTKIRTLAQSAGFEVADAEVIRNWTHSFSEIFKDVHLRESKKTVREMLTNMVGSAEQKIVDNNLEYVDRVEWTDEAAAPLSQENSELAKEIFELASHYPVFRDYANKGGNEHNIIYVMRSMYRKLQPKDFSRAELEGFRNTLLEWRNGYGFFNWLYRKGGFKVLKDAQKLAREEGREFHWYHTIQFAKTVADATKVDDILLVDRSLKGATRVPLKTFVENPDGSVKTIVKSGRVLDAEPHFDMLRRVNGENLTMLSENMKHGIWAKMSEELAFADAGVVDVTSGENHLDELFSIAVHEMQLEGFERMLEKPLSKRMRAMARTGQYKERKMAKFARKKYMERLDVKQDKDDPNVNFRKAMNRKVQITTKNGQVSMTVREAINFMKDKTLFLTGLHDKHVSAKDYAAKNITPFLIQGEIDMAKLRSRLSDMIDGGQATEQTGGHLTFDAARLINVENSIGKLAKLRLEDEVIPMDSDAVSRLEFYPDQQIIELLGKPVIKSKSDLLNLQNRLEKMIEEAEVDDPAALRLEGLSKYLNKRLEDNDMRQDWQDITHYSQFETDLAVSSGNLTKINYIKKKIRDAAPLPKTDKLEGFFPHVQFDKQILDKDAINEIEYEHPNMSAEERTKHITRIYDSYMRMKRIANGEDNDATLDSFSDHILTGDTAEFIKNSAGISSGRQAESFSSAFGRGTYWAGYLTEIGAIRKYGEMLSRATYRNLSAMLSGNIIDHFEASGAMGDHNATWGNWMRLYVRDVMGRATTFPEHLLNDPQMNLKRTPYYWLSDHNMITKNTLINRAFTKALSLHRISEVEKAFYRQTHGGEEMSPTLIKSTERGRMEKLTKPQPGETVTKEQAELFGHAYRGFSDVEAKFEMMSLLFHAKSYMNNIFGGSTNLIAYTGWKPFLRAQKLDEWKAINPEKFRTMDDVLNWVSSMGVIEDFVLHEAAVTGRFRTGKWKDFFDEASEAIASSKGKLTDVKLYQIAKRNGVSQKAVDAGAWFMRKSERFLRTRAFLAGYLQARDGMRPMDVPFDHPHLINMGRKAVSASQFLYGSAERPAFARTSFGKVFSRFKLWGWNSIKFRREIYQEAKRHGWEVGSIEFDRLKRIMFADMFVVSLASMFPFSMFENTLPPPFSWFQDLSEYFFGDEYDRQKAFFGSPLGPLNELTPVLFSRPISFGNEIFKGLVSDDHDSKAMYYLATMFPFGRMGYDTVRAFNSPRFLQEYLVGLPLRQFGDLKDAVTAKQLFTVVAPIIEENVNGPMTTAEITGMLINEGLSESDVTKALAVARKRGLLTRSMQGKGYIWMRSGASRDFLLNTEFGTQSYVRGL